MAVRRVLIDGFNIGLSMGSGIATYARNLAGGLAALGYETQVLHGPARKPGRNRLLNEVSLSDAPQASQGPGRISGYIAVGLSPYGRTAVRVQESGAVLRGRPGPSEASAGVHWAARDVFHTANRAHARSRRFTPLTLKDGQVEVAHWTTALPLTLKGAANLYTIHDLVPLKLPFATLDNKSQFYALCRRICREADHVVTVSETSRRDIIETFGIAEDRITNTYQAVDIPPALRDRPAEEAAADVEGVFGLGWKRYFLYFGAIEPKKNLARIIEAYLGSGATDPLVIVGGQAWLAEAETRLLYPDLVQMSVIRDSLLRREDRIRRYDYLPFAMLVSLIRGAKATLFPSLYEGFGLPVLESMQLGTPVLASTGGALPEVAGDAAILADPFDAQSIRRGIRALDADEGLRADLVARGQVQAAKFTTAAYQERLKAVYGRLA